MIKFFRHIHYRNKILLLQNQRSIRLLVMTVACGKNGAMIKKFREIH